MTVPRTLFGAFWGSLGQFRVRQVRGVKISDLRVHRFRV